MIKARARAFQWRWMLDECVCGTIEELAKRERVNRGYMSRVLRLTVLAPDIVEAILDGRQSEGMQLAGSTLQWTDLFFASRGLSTPNSLPSLSGS